jgi:hypothetical protein
MISTRVAKVNFLSITQNGRRMCAWLDEFELRWQELEAVADRARAHPRHTRRSGGGGGAVLGCAHGGATASSLPARVGGHQLGQRRGIRRVPQYTNDESLRHIWRPQGL